MAFSSMATTSNATNFISCTTNNPYLIFNPSNPTYTTITNTGTLVLPQWRLLAVVPRSSEELIEIARRACGLMLRAEAEKVPHVYYSSNSTASIDSNIKGNDRDSVKDSGNITTKLEPSSSESNSNSQCTGDGTIIKQESPSQVSSHQLLHSFQRVRDNRKHRRNRTHHSNPSPNSNKIIHTRPTCKVNSVDNNSQPQVEARTRNNSRPRLVIRFGYEKEFLAGPPKKTEVSERRIFYQRKFFCRRV